MEVIVNFVSISCARGGLDSLAQQRMPPVPRIADAEGNARAPGHPGSLEGILKQYGCVEALRTNFLHQFPEPPGPTMLAIGVINDLAANGRMVPINFTDPRLRHQNDFGVWKAGAQRLDSGQGHHRVADPIGGPHHDLFRIVRVAVVVFHGALRARSRSATSACSNSIFSSISA